MTKPTLLQIDDDGFFAALFREELEEEYEVEFCRSAEDALRAIERGTRYAAILLDIMMTPPSAELSAETDNGMSTGIWLLRSARDEIVGRPLPVVVLTNRTDDHLGDEIAELGLPDGLVECHLKRATSAADLPSIVRKVIERNRRVTS